MSTKLLKLNITGNIGRYFSTTSSRNATHSCKLLIVGGGTAGCTLGAKFSRKLKKNELIILEPSDSHYYQPLFTLVGGGIYTVEDARRNEAEVLPKNCTWIKDNAAEFDPKNNTVVTSKGDQIKYEYMAVATGIHPNYEKIPGLVEALRIPDGKVCSNYSPNYAPRTYQALLNFKSGNAVFTYPDSPVKCPGAPQKICYITDDYLRKSGKRSGAKVIYNTSLPVLFGVKVYADALWTVCKSRDIDVNLRTNLVEVKPDKDEAIFQNLDNPEEKTVLKYSMLHVTPPMSTSPELRACKDLVTEAGFVEVDKSTLQHVRFRNVFALGDCSSSPNSKTAAAAAGQCSVVFKNLSCVMESREPCRVYDGYASCPLVTGYNKCIMAEFDYNLQPLETFPFAQDKERQSMFLIKKYALPKLYWHLMLPGYWSGPAFARKLMRLGVF